MHKTNFCAHALDDIRRYEHQQTDQILIRQISELKRDLHKSIKFRMPDGGRIFDGEIGESTEYLNRYTADARLPFPVCALEFNCDRLGVENEHSNVIFDRLIVVAKESVIDGHASILVRSMYRAKGTKEFGDVWCPNNYVVAIRCADKSLSFWPGHKGASLEGDACISDTQTELTALCQFIAAMSCGNARTADDQAPDIELNRRRVQGGKQPFFTYKILEIAVTGYSGSSVVSSAVFGGHKRVHLRRGHIRRLRDRNIWINSCVVGDKSKGFIHKDYSVVS